MPTRSQERTATAAAIAVMQHSEDRLMAALLPLVPLWLDALTAALRENPSSGKVTLDLGSLPGRPQLNEAFIRQVNDTLTAAWEFTSKENIAYLEDLRARLLKRKPRPPAKSALGRLLAYFAPDPAPAPDTITISHAPVPALDELGQVIADQKTIRVKPVRGLKAYESRAIKLAGIASAVLLEGAKSFVYKNHEQGKGLREIEKNLRSWFPGFTRSRCNNIARTESSHLFNASRLQHYNETPAIVGYRFAIIDDTRTTDICISRANMTFKKGQEAGNTPPLHYRCRSRLVPIWYWEDKKTPWTALDDPKLLPPLKGFGDLTTSMPGALKLEVPPGGIKPPFHPSQLKKTPAHLPSSVGPAKPAEVPSGPTPQPEPPAAVPEPLPPPAEPVALPPEPEMPPMPARPKKEVGKSIGGPGGYQGPKKAAGLPEVSPSGGAGRPLMEAIEELPPPPPPYVPEVESDFWVRSSAAKGGNFRVSATYPDPPGVPFRVVKDPFGDGAGLSFPAERDVIEGVLREAEEFWHTGGAEVRAIRKADGAPLTEGEYAFRPRTTSLHLDLTFDDVPTVVTDPVSADGLAEIRMGWKPVTDPSARAVATGEGLVDSSPFRLAQAIRKSHGIAAPASELSSATVSAGGILRATSLTELANGTAVHLDDLCQWLGKIFDQALVKTGTTSARSRGAVCRNILKYLNGKYKDQLAAAAVRAEIADTAADWEFLLNDLLRAAPRPGRRKLTGLVEETFSGGEGILPGLEEAIAKGRGPRTFLRGDRDFIERHEVCVSSFADGWTSAEFRVTTGNGARVEHTLNAGSWERTSPGWSSKPYARGYHAGTSETGSIPYSRSGGWRGAPKTYSCSIDGTRVVVSFCKGDAKGVSYWSNRAVVHVESRDPDVIRRTLAEVAKRMGNERAFFAVDEEAELALRQAVVNWADRKAAVSGRVVLREVAPGYTTHVEEGFAAANVPEGVTGVWSGTESADAVVSICDAGHLQGINDRFLQLIAEHDGDPFQNRYGTYGTPLHQHIFNHEDANSGGAESCFTRLEFAQRWTEGRYRSSYHRGGYQLRFRREVLDRMDWWGSATDVYGDVAGPEFISRKGRADFCRSQLRKVEQSRTVDTGNELMFRHGLAVQDVRDISCAGQSYFDTLIDKLRRSGHSVSLTGSSRARVVLNSGPAKGHAFDVFVEDY